MLPKTGRKLHHADADRAFAAMMAQALGDELGRTHQAVKTAMRWTGASERTVKHWMAGTHAPSGRHTLSLIRHSDLVVKRLLAAAGRRDLTLNIELAAAREVLLEAIGLFDALLVQQSPP